MSKIEKFTFLGKTYEVETFGDQNVQILNGDLVRGKVTGVAFDFDGTITGGASSDDIRDGVLENYRVRPEMIRIINEVQKNNIRTVILTSALWEWVERRMDEDGYLKELTKLKTISIRENIPYKVGVKKLRDIIGDPYMAKIPTIVGCNVIVDDSFAHSQLHGKFGKKLGYSFIDVSKMKTGDEKHLRNALESLGAL